VILLARDVQWRRGVKTRQIDVGAAREAQPHHVDVVFLAGDDQRRQALRRLIDGGAAVEEQRRRVNVIVLAREQQRSASTH